MATLKFKSLVYYQNETYNNLPKMFECTFRNHFSTNILFIKSPNLSFGTVYVVLNVVSWVSCSHHSKTSWTHPDLACYYFFFSFRVVQTRYLNYRANI